MKRIIKLSLVAVFACFAGYNVYQSQKQVELSDLTLANIEALAGGGEGGLNECIGCMVTSQNLCKTYGNWGACIGDWDGITKEL